MAFDISAIKSAVAANDQKLEQLLATVDAESTQVASFREEQRAAIAELQRLLSEGSPDPAEVQSLVDDLTSSGSKIDSAIAKIQAIQE